MNEIKEYIVINVADSNKQIWYDTSSQLAVCIRTEDEDE